MGADLQGRMNQQRAVGLLWNHANEAHRTVRRENHKVDFLDWGPHSEGVFASEALWVARNPARGRHSRRRVL